MFDDLIPQQSTETSQGESSVDPWAQFKDAPVAAPPPVDPWAQFKDAPSAPAPAIPPLPPGFTLDAAPTAGAGSTELLGTTPAQGDQPARVIIGTNPTGLQRIREAIDPLNVVSNVGSTLANSGRSLAVGAQGVAKGLVHTAAMPFDLMAGAQNLAMSGVNRLLGTDIPMATPASQLAEKVAAPYLIPREDISPNERLAENISDFGTQALTAGGALAARAPAVAAAAKPAAKAVGRFIDNLSRPYIENGARTVLGDAVGGAGAGAGVSAADEYLPKEPTGPFGQGLKTAATILAPLLGGVGATTAQGAAEGLGGLLRGMANRAFTSAPREIPLNPSTKLPFSNADIDRAAERMQAAASGPPQAVARDIRENAAELTNPSLPGETYLDASALPTSGLLSRDPGLVTLEGGARSKSSPAFITRDQNVKEAAAQRVEKLRDAEADLGAVFRRAGEARKERLAPSETTVRSLEEENKAASAARLQQGAEFGVVANTNAQATASRNLDRAVVDQNYAPARTEKNRQFDEAPGRTQEVDAQPVIDAVQRVRDRANALGPANQMPGELMQRLDQLAEPGAVVDGGTLADLRKYIGPAREAAQRAGNFDLADNIGSLGQAINRTIENAPGYADANANYRQFAERFRPERNDEGAKFTREIDRGGQQPDGTLNRGSTPPSETADRFLSSPEKAQALNRMLAGAPSEQAGQAAVRDYMRSDFAMSVLNPDGSINPARAAAWNRNNADVLAQFPNLQREFDGVVQSARRGERLTVETKVALENARRMHHATEADIDRSAIGTLLREDPRDVANGFLNGGYSSGKKLDEINALVKNDATAKRGWKAAMSEVLADRVQGSRVVGETPEVQFARLAKEFKDNEALLAKTFAPDEMNNLRQAHKLLGYFKEAEKRATVGSNTADKWNVPGWAQLIVRHAYGDLRGGGIVKRFKLLLDMLPTNKKNADEIVHMAWFNPDVAAYLLERPIKNSNVPQYNVNLRRLIAADNYARDRGASDGR